MSPGTVTTSGEPRVAGSMAINANDLRSRGLVSGRMATRVVSVDKLAALISTTFERAA
jgi:hypothetical protein